jgi:putative aldouronate transport system substrate-binding protein
MAPSEQGVSRRTFVRLSVSAAASVGLWLVACGTAPTPPGPAPSPAGAGTSVLKLPSYVPFNGLKPDLPADNSGVDPAFFTFPQTLTRSVNATPGSGGDVTAVTILTQNAPAPVEQNAAWQAINTDLGVNLKFTLALNNDYPAKLAAIVAGGDLPDLMFNTITGSIQNVPDFVRTQCADLTPYLAGDAVKDYPNLATLPTLAWKSCVFNGAIYGVPISRPPFNQVQIIRKDLFDATGLGVPKTAEDLKRILVGITHAPDRWGTGALGTMAFNLTAGSPLVSMFGAPNNWKLASGHLMKDFETEEFRAAVGYAHDLFAAGLYHPDSVTMTVPQANTNFNGGKFAMYVSSWFAYELKWQGLASAGSPKDKVDILDPFGHDGGQPLYHFGPGSFGMSFVKKSTPDRTRMLLRILNYLAAPFGTQEWALLSYGVKGVDYNLDDSGNPVLTNQGKADITDAPVWKYLTVNAPTLFDIYSPKDWATGTHAHEQALARVGTLDPTLGLFSPTYSGTSVTFNGNFYSGITDIVAGRRPTSEFDALVTTWRAQGGDRSRAEYEQALATAGAGV